MTRATNPATSAPPQAALDSGVTPKIVSDCIGHSDLRVTFQVYGHRSTGQDREAAELVAALIREALDLPSTR